ncbi:MAG TPA: CvpA family protein [Chthoniobacterales bacterium]|nr:CvpA family protein [Chthoniobacterales bacterium]
MNSQLQAASGSPLWQLVFVSFALALILFEVLRGWRRGLPRQVARLGALVAAYFAGFFGGKFLGPLLGMFVKMPDALLSIFAGAIFALIIYAVICGIGSALFRRTSQHDSLIVRLLYGSTGALLGVFFGLFLVWLIVVAVRSIGSVADAQVREQASDSSVLHAVDVRRRFLGEANEDQAPLTTSMARLKNSLEMGVIGNTVKKIDVVPQKTYDLLEKISAVAANPQNAERFLSFPGARELSEHPKIIALRNDQEISQMLAQGQLIELIQDHRIIDAANDADLHARLKKFDLDAALNYALQKPQ